MNRIITLVVSALYLLVSSPALADDAQPVKLKLRDPLC